MVKRTLTDEEIQAQIPAARARAKRRRAVRARGATYDRETGRVVVELTNACQGVVHGPPRFYGLFDQNIDARVTHGDALLVKLVDLIKGQI